MQDLFTKYPWLLAAMLVLMLSEWAWARSHGRTYSVKTSFASLGVAVGQALIKPLGAAMVIGVYVGLHEFALFKLPLDDWRFWVLGFFAVEFVYYWFHRFSHKINWLWATHAVHHSANEFTLPTALRLGWTGTLSGGWLVFVPLPLLGFPPFMVVSLLAFNLLYQFWLHTEMIRSLGVFEWVLNTPSHHRAHHASDEQWLDCNFGGVLIVFDRWFGTFVPEPEQGGLHYGLTTPIKSNNPFVIALQQWKLMAQAFLHARTSRDRFRALFGSPSAIAQILRQPKADQ
jgi:sterol desaturase/sphingolipid hydroxylase (fatty acid hydroxylase superfamily)